MLSADELVSYTSASIDTCANEDLQHRLSLYQVFLKLYEHHRGLLDEILHLENSGSKSLAGVTLPYVQGVLLEGRVHLATNLLQGKTQALVQPQQVWVLGRDPHKASIAIQDSRLSRCHAAIQYVAGQGFFLVDLGSRNGSFINGERVWRSTLLKDGDRVRLGSLSFVFFICQTAQVLAPLSPETRDYPQLTHPKAKRPALSELRSAGRVMPSEGRDEFINSQQGTFTFMSGDAES
ncbi:MAG: FHA domain-containing protein [Oscillatoriophycideae cyanobacterium NC_groundwater_1537_Pr4_S-0.65um_50_18]|nr:FHA domain-containing protein [Oscillatoriophycideae cyanobacterium NC_groundwater_1537_Pr4_S-0.65um_50_18]